jgi:hypothetical protein
MPLKIPPKDKEECNNEDSIPLLSSKKTHDVPPKDKEERNVQNNEHKHSQSPSEEIFDKLF